MKISYGNNKFKISAPTWNYKFDLPGRSYSVSDIQDYSVKFQRIPLICTGPIYGQHKNLMGLYSETL